MGTAGDQLYNLTAITRALNRIDMEINAKAGLTTTNETNEPWATVFAGIEEDIVAMHILRARHFQMNNLTENVTSFWQIVPSFTREHQRMFTLYRNQHTSARNYSMTSGDQIQ